MADDDWAVIVKVGAAGGSVSLFGQARSDGQWQYRVRSVDQTAGLLSDENAAAGEASDRSGPVVNAWDAALGMLDRYPWAMLHPLAVHPEFVERTRVGVEERLAKREPSPHVGHARAKWERVLGEAVASRASR